MSRLRPADAALFLAALLLAALPSAAAEPGPAAGRLPGAEPAEESPPGQTEEPYPLPAGALCRRGDHALEDGSRSSLRRAEELFRSAVRQHPADPCGHAGLARALSAMHMRGILQDDAVPSEAAASARRAIEIDASSARARAALAGALLADLSPSEAAASAEAAVALDPQDAVAWQAASATRLAQGLALEAREAAQRAIALRPDLPGGHHALGNAERMAGRLPEAIDAYRVAVVLSPDYLPSQFQLGAAIEHQGRYQHAASVFKLILQDHPEEAGVVHLFMAQSLMRREEWDAALAMLGRCELANRRGLGKGTLLYLEALCLEELGRANEAVQRHARLIEEFPEATIGYGAADRLLDKAHEAIARMARAEGRPGEALAALERGAERPSASPDLLLRLARLYEEYNLPGRAVSVLERAAGREVSAATADAQLTAFVAWARLAGRTGDAAGLERLAAALQERAGSIDALGDVVHDLAAMRALSLAGRGEAALGWLRRALQRGYDRTGWIADDPDLAALRAAPGFASSISAPTPRSSSN
ncbi:MAG TPA: hypothetical protein VJV23_02025 [Candidatus Polarisedimenticolia bacterium]|nr:hypothetical protein [Candidatus Polarisedimenticolia bacterium]